MKRVGRKSIGLLRDEFLLYRDSDYMAINKPLGISTIAGRDVGREFRELLKSMELLSGSESPIPVNSMSESVSGVQLLSLHASAGRIARSMIKSGQFWKCKYWGILSRNIRSHKQSSGVINIPLKDGVPDPSGEPSITHWKLVKNNNELSLVEFEPRTDIINQIPIHCDISLRAPLLTSVGLHLLSVTASLTGGTNVEIRASVKGELKQQMQILGWT